MKQIKKVLAPIGRVIKYQDIVSTTIREKLHLDGDIDTKSYTGGALTICAQLVMSLIFF